MDGDEVSCGQHGLEIVDLFHASGAHGGRIDVRIKTYNTRSEPLTDHARHAPADAADADEANGLASDILSEPALLRPNPAFAGDRSSDRRESLGQSDHQGKGAFRDCLVRIVRHIDDGNAAPPGRDNINCVNSDAILDDAFEPR